MTVRVRERSDESGSLSFKLFISLQVQQIHPFTETQEEEFVEKKSQYNEIRNEHIKTGWPVTFPLETFLKNVL